MIYILVLWAIIGNFLSNCCNICSHFCNCFNFNLFFILQWRYSEPLPQPYLTIFFSVTSLTLPFLWFDDIILQSFELTYGIDKGQLPGSKNFFSVSSEVACEIWEPKLQQIMSAIFSCKGDPFLFGYFFKLFQTLGYSVHIGTLYQAMNHVHLFMMHAG